MEGFPTPITAARGSFIYSYTYRVNADYTITPTQLLHIGAGFYIQNFNDPSPTLNYDTVKELGLKGATLLRNFPIINVGSTGIQTGGMNNLGPAAAIQGSNYERRPSGVASMTWVKGNHTYKYGGEWRGERYPEPHLRRHGRPLHLRSNSTQQSSLQALTLSQGVTGFPFASFLMGDLTQVEIRQPTPYSYGKNQTGFYIQDTWKLTRKLTSDYGLRYDYGAYAARTLRPHRQLQPAAAQRFGRRASGGYQYEAICNCKFAHNYKAGLGPRLGASLPVE